MRSGIISIAITFILYTPLISQNSKRTNVWYFGRNAGIDFNNGTPAPLTDGAINIWEGCATLCDTFGQLLMYTDGIKIWNKNHQIMPGATNLGGDNSATQSGIFVPKPNSPNEIYVFSVDKEGQSGGLQYAIVDMNLNGGLGGLITSNNLLLPHSAEKITAIQHCNKLDYWLIAHQSNSANFYIWKVTSGGISSPIITSIGSYHGTYLNAIGYLKGSPNGSRIALGVYGSDFFEVFNFDNTIGEISNPILLTDPQFSNPYGVEFSPNGNLLYVAGTQNSPKIFQYNVSLNTAQEIQNSGVLVGQGTSSYFGALQLAPNDKIYIAKDNSKYLSTINNPNALGLACNFIENDFYLNEKESGLGLPNLIPTFFKEPVSINVLQNVDYCSGRVNLETSVNAQADSIVYQWYLNGNYLQGQNNANIQVNVPGNYKLIVFLYSDCQIYPSEYTQTVTVDIPTTSNSQYIHRVICEGQSYEGYSTTGVFTDTLPFLASNGCDSLRILSLNVLPSAINNLTISICENEVPYEGHTTSGVYIDTFVTTNGCDSIKTLNLTVLPTLTSNQSVFICENETPYEGYSISGVYIDTLVSENGCDSTRILDLTVSPILVNSETVYICEKETPYEGYSSTGVYIDTLQSVNACDSIRILQLFVNSEYERIESVTICEGSSYGFFGQSISNQGEYKVVFPTIFGCDSVFILDLKTAQSDFLGNDTTICIAGEYQLSSPSENTIWSDLTTSKTKNIYTSGIYWATILDANDCEITDTIFVQFNANTFMPNIFSPNNDGINDEFTPYFYPDNFIPSRFSVFDRWGNLIFSTTASNFKGWNGKYNGTEGDCAPGIYVYFVEIETAFCDKVVLKGDITLVR